MGKQRFLNNFETIFIAAVKDAPTSGSPANELDYGILRISDGAAGQLINPSSGDYYVLTAYKRAGTVESNIEIMRVTAVNNAVPGECRITVLRGQEGTTPQAYVAGDRLALRLTAGAATGWIQDGDPRLTDARAPTGPAGGVLAGTYPNPSFAVDMATQAELDAHVATVSGAHAASAISNSPSGGISATNVQAAINELDTEKEPVIAPGTTSQYWRGDKTWRDFFTDVRAATLTGLSTAVNAVVTATDTVLSATGKLQAQITGLASSKLNVNATSFSGNAATATKLQTARTISLSGDASGSVSFDGSGDVSISTVVADNSHNHVIANVDGLQLALNGKLDRFELPPQYETQSWYKIAELTTNIGSNTNGLVLFVSGIGDFGSNKPGVDIVQVSTRGWVSVDVYDVVPTTIIDTAYGYVNNAGTGKTELWVRRDAYNYKTDVAVAMAYDATYGNLGESVTEPAGITYVSKKKFYHSGNTHTHTASQISDSTAVGRSVLTAADAAAARAAIGALPTSSPEMTGAVYQNGSVSSNIVDIVSGTNFDLSLGNYFIRTVNGNVTFTVSNTPASRAYAFTVEITHTSGTITWFSGVVWPGGTAPTLTTGRVHLFTFVTDNGGTTWRAIANVNYTS